MATLYVTEQGSRIEKEYHRLLVTLDGEVIQSVLLRSISEVVLVGTCGATTPAMLSLLDHGVGLTFINRSGRLRGRLRPAMSSNLTLRLQQYACQQDDTFCLQIAKNIVRGKTSNYRTMARRLLRSIQAVQERSVFPVLLRSGENQKLEELERSISRFNLLLAQVKTTQDMDKLRGLEGTASKLYFAYLRAGLRWPDEKAFAKRQRRPPRDPINAMLSLGYSILGQCLVTAVEVVGLDPLAGFFHTNQYGRPSLALDLVEEFRPVIVDSIIWRMVNQHMIKPVHFTVGDGGEINLTRQGLKIFFQQFHRRINTRIFHPRAGRPLTYQKCFEVQAGLLRKVITGEEAEYIPMPWK